MLFPSIGFGDLTDFVGVEAHLKRLTSMLCLESEEVRMVGIVGPSGIGKSTIGRALFSQLSSQFHHHVFVTYKKPSQQNGKELRWEKKFLKKTLSIKIENPGEVKFRLKHRKVLIVLDDVADLAFLTTLVGKPEWFGHGSRIIVITQDRHILKSHEIEHIYEVEFPSEDLALKMLCRSAFEKDSPPDGFMELVVEVTKLAGNLPLGLSTLGKSLRGRDKDELMKILPELQNGLNGDIKQTLRVCYDRLDIEGYRKLFLYIACFFKGKKVSDIKDLLGGLKDIGLSDIGFGLTILAEKSLIRITPGETVEMHDLLQKLGIEIDRADDRGRRFLTNAEDILEAVIGEIKREQLLGLYLDSPDHTEPVGIVLFEKSLESMPNLRFLDVKRSSWREGIIFPPDAPSFLEWDKRIFPRALRLIKWDNCPARSFPSHFKAEFLVELTLRATNLTKLWEGTQTLGCLKKMDMRCNKYLEKLPDLSYAINLEKLIICWCSSLVTLPFSFQNISKLRWFDMGLCENLENFPTHLNLASIEYLNIFGCSKMKNFPQFEMHITTPLPHEYTRYFYLFPPSSSMASSSFSWRYDAFASFIGEIISKLFRSHQLDRKSVHIFRDDEMEITSSIPSSSFSSRRYDIFPSFSGEDVCKSYLSHIVKELDRKSINTFIDNGIGQSLPIGPAHLSAIRESRISIVIFSKNYASSTRCLDELVEIHKCFKELDQIVIPVFYKVSPLFVRELDGEFRKVFEETCKGKPEDHKQRWIHALTDIVNLAGEDQLLRLVMTTAD